MTRSRNLALAASLAALAILFYAVTLVRMRESEDRRHLDDPKAHSAPAEPTSPKP
ncbi:MAG: hypothetical protein GY873_16425 [Bosea sp.]|uniref:hypothetical protein n=1 Tax=Bosea sp. (in: a-proteobacteria) TaxID=1871050 RepID=UPI0023973E84|nr:hypothetical protein [Bosea sp. (in: a-proteobacteria)]MCP4735773.1 hypothetical protein [Bosea sp. (in: a-proteobacteria)]